MISMSCIKFDFSSINRSTYIFSRIERNCGVDRAIKNSKAILVFKINDCLSQ
jgi:hypothetical protein